MITAASVQWDIFRQDLRYTVRHLRRARGFALTAVGIIALGIGANTAAFSVTDFVLLRPLPFADPDRLVAISQRSAGGAYMDLAPGNIRDWRAAAVSFERVGIHRRFEATLTGAGEPRRLSGRAITADVFATLGVSAALGRVFVEGEDSERAPRTVILSHGFWQAAFAGDPAVIGRTLTLNDRAYEVIGVMPAAFRFPWRDVELWVPLALPAAQWEDRNNNEFYAVARLKPGVTLEAARAELDVLAAQTRRQFPRELANTGAMVTPYRERTVTPESRTTLLALSGAALGVLLIVCANLANLLLARALGRRHELTVRAALGAGRDRLLRQLATESVVLAALGGLLGVLLAIFTVPLLWQLVPVFLPTDAMPGIDLRVLAFAAVVTFATALGFGVAPVVRAGAHADARGLREGARAVGGRDAVRSALVVAEVTASVVLLIATGLLLRTLWNIQARDPGFNADGVLTVAVDLPMARYGLADRRSAFYDDVLDRVRALPGVTDAAFTSGLPLIWRGGLWPVGVEGVEIERREDNVASVRTVTPGFFAAMHVPIHAGRDVRAADTTTSGLVAIASESFAQRHWPGQDVLGRRFNVLGSDRTIVGVVGDVRVRGLERDSEPQVYLPYRQSPDRGWVGYMPRELVVRATAPLGSLAPAVRGIILDVDPQQPISAIRSMGDVLELETMPRAVQVRVLAVFAGIAFLLAAIGLHGVLAFAVSQRTPEIGVRMALGAQRRDILRMVIGQGVLLVAIGLTLGLVLALFAGRVLQAALAGVTPADPRTFAAATALTVLMAMGGVLLPALRAARIDPMKAIRVD